MRRGARVVSHQVDELGLGEVLAWAIENDGAERQDDHSVRDLESGVNVMGDQDYSCPLRGQPATTLSTLAVYSTLTPLSAHRG